MFVVTLLLCALLGGIAILLGRLVVRAVTRGSDPARVKRVHGLVVAIGAGLVVALGPAFAKTSVGDTVAVALRLKSKSEIILDDAMRPLVEDPRLQAELAGKDATVAQAHVAELTARGIALLPARDLETWASLRLRLADASPVYCAATWRGGLAPRDLFRALDAVTDEEQRRFGALIARAGKLALDTPPTETAHGRDLMQGIAAIGATLPPAERAAFDGDVGLADPGPERACELHRLVLRGAVAFPSPEREAFLRALAALAR
jgi:hypothetical protein